ncbi:lasso peptide biosynthesis B2 protein [Pseudoxanthomonas wuyuanensis]
MPYHLKEDLSCCEVDGHVVFLDLEKDRYFRLSSDNEAVFQGFLANRDLPDEQSRKLVEIGILVEAASRRHDADIPIIQRPSRSAVEQPIVTTGHHLGITVILEVLALIWSTQRQLSSRTLSTVIDDTTSRRRIRTDLQSVAEATPSEDSLVGAATEFSRARSYVPIEPSCLLDSLSLVRFLSRRRLQASIVFGVTLVPFAAHCWVQAGEIVLNETLSNANAHTPIKVV